MVDNMVISWCQWFEFNVFSWSRMTQTRCLSDQGEISDALGPNPVAKRAKNWPGVFSLQARRWRRGRRWRRECCTRRRSTQTAGLVSSRPHSSSCCCRRATSTWFGSAPKSGPEAAETGPNRRPCSTLCLQTREWRVKRLFHRSAGAGSWPSGAKRTQSLKVRRIYQRILLQTSLSEHISEP